MLSYFLRVGARLAGVVALTMLLAVIAPAQDDDAIPDRYHKSKEPVYLTPQPDHALLYVTRSEYVRLFGLSDFKVLAQAGSTVRPLVPQARPWRRQCFSRTLSPLST